MGWVIDLDGVMWLADEPIPGSAAAIAEVQNSGQPVVFVTNNSFSPVAAVEEKLASHGVDAAGAVITSAMAAASLVTEGEQVLVCGGAGLQEELEKQGAVLVTKPEAETVVVGLALDLSYDLLARATTAVRNGARLLASNDDATFPTPQGQVPGAGAILAAVVTATGHPAQVAGKPHQPMVDLVRSRLGTQGIVVGDRPDTDGLFAHELRYRFALVLSGVTRPGDLPVTPAPDLVAPDLLAVVKDPSVAPGSGRV